MGRDRNRAGGRLLGIAGAPTRLLRSLTAAVVAVGLVTMVAGTASADIVQNEGTVQIQGADTVTIPSGGTASVGYWIEQGGQGGLPACDATAASPAVVTPTLPTGTPAPVTASPASRSFTSCGSGAVQSITFGSSTPGSYTIPVAVQDASGVYNTQPAQFTLIVTAAPANTAPVVTVQGPTDGSTYPKGSVPSPSCSVVDAEDTGESATPSVSAITGPDAATGIGSQTVTCSYTDAGGLSDTESVTYAIEDGSAPTIAYQVTGTKGLLDWYVSNVTLTWIVTEGDSPSTLVKTGCEDQNITADQSEVTYSCDASSDGGDAEQVEVKIKRDATAPTISYAMSPAVGSTGWWNGTTGAPTVTYTCADSGPSGLASCTDAHTFGEGANQSHTGTASDVAGNTASDGPTDVDVDLTAPTISAAVTPAAASSDWWNIATGAPTVTYTCGDTGGSGVASCTSANTFGEGEDQTHTGTATDTAGNSNTASVSNIDVDLTAPGIVSGWDSAFNGSIYFGSVPDNPSCTATDGMSGPKSCAVTGHGAGLGQHTLTATAADNADNTSTATKTYTVSAWTLNGFYQPVDMNGVWNTVKGGSTVPLKFEIFAGPTELTNISAIQSVTAKGVACNVAPTDEVEVTTTGGTSLRYDTTGGQFVYNWQTPKGAGKCYVVTMTTQDGSSLTAKFQTK